HGTVCVVGKIRDLILQLSKSSIYSTKPSYTDCSMPMIARRFRPLLTEGKQNEKSAYRVR
ncbi:hypothetical protein ACH6X5_13990, partial [Klebsiella pneumoniae]